MKATVDELIEYAESTVGNPYCWGGNGETLSDIIKSFARKCGQSDSDTETMLEFLNKKKFKDFHLQDCSGNVVRFLREKNILQSDINANGLYLKCEKTNEPKEGYLAFFIRQQMDEAYHVGIVVRDGYVIHALNQSVGVIKEKISKRKNWVFGKPSFAIKFTEEQPKAETGDEIELKKDVYVFTNAVDAEAHNYDNKYVKYKAGKYFVYKTYGNCTNITRTIGVAGGWISNKDLKGAI